MGKWRSIKTMIFYGLLLFISCSEVNNKRPFNDTLLTQPKDNNEWNRPEIDLQGFNQLPKGTEVGKHVFYHSEAYGSRPFIFINNKKGSAWLKVNGKLILLQRKKKEQKEPAVLFEEYKGSGWKATIEVEIQLVDYNAQQYKGTLTVTNGFKKVSTSIYAHIDN